MEDLVINLAQEAVTMVLLLAAPMLLFGLIVGLLVSIFQATTQIQEATLAFVPKIFAVLMAFMIFNPWMLNKLKDFTIELFSNMHLFIK